MSAMPCPPPKDLERLLDERLDAARLPRVSAHVASCPACQKALEALTAGAGASTWRGPAHDSRPPHPSFLDRMKQAPPVALPSGGAPPAEPFPVLEGYEILAVLGRGAEGVVYKALHRPLGRVVALKTPRDADRAAPETVARFRREAETLAQLRHRNIVRICEAGVRNGRPFIAMEYVAGGPLSARLTGEPRPARKAAALVKALARGVHAAHKAGILHCDLKPANVLLESDGGPAPRLTPRIGDFGLARRLEGEPSRIGAGFVVGTPAYMAPEQARAEGGVLTPACDVYALGSILYHLLTGRPPFAGGRPMDVLLRVVHEQPTPPRRLAPRIPRELERICLKCLRKNPLRRYASAAALAKALRRCLARRRAVALKA